MHRSWLTDPGAIRRQGNSDQPRGCSKLCQELSQSPLPLGTGSNKVAESQLPCLLKFPLASLIMSNICNHAAKNNNKNYKQNTLGKQLISKQRRKITPNGLPREITHTTLGGTQRHYISVSKFSTVKTAVK